MTQASPVSFAILGCGSRGRLFSQWIADHPDQAKVVAVAEPDAERRDIVGDQHRVPAALRFEKWEQLLDRPRLADAVVNALMDQLHVASATKAMSLGYHMLLEKPMAVTLPDCIAIDAAQQKYNRVVCVCHTLRYHATYRKLRELLDEEAVGEIITIDQLEGVDPAHQAHSFVRGNWGREAHATFMLMQKSCHDIDIVMYLMNRPCVRVSSFGSLSHFRRENMPKGATPRCVDGCAVERQCPYSAIKLYVEDKGWYSSLIGADKFSPQRKQEFVRTSRYGRCVYDLDNDVVDHQVVNFEFDNNATATFTMTAFSPAGRHVRIHGTRGFIRASVDDRRIELVPFWGENPQPVRFELPEESGGHGGGDSNAMFSLVAAIRASDPSMVATPTDASLATHRVVFAAERARRENRIVTLAELEA